MLNILYDLSYFHWFLVWKVAESHEGQQYEDNFSGKSCEMSKSQEKGDQREKEQKAIHFKQTAHNWNPL